MSIAFADLAHPYIIIDQFNNETNLLTWRVGGCFEIVNASLNDRNITTPTAGIWNNQTFNFESNITNMSTITFTIHCDQLENQNSSYFAKSRTDPKFSLKIGEETLNSS
jgi:hypothetical protein